MRIKKSAALLILVSAIAAAPNLVAGPAGAAFKAFKGLVGEVFEDAVESYANNSKSFSESINALKKKAAEVAVEIRDSELSQNSKEAVKYLLDDQRSLKKAVRPFLATFPVTIFASPEDASVRIMNITTKYRDGILLSKGRYDIEVTHPGYRTQRFWIDFDSQYHRLEVNLNKKGNLECNDNKVTYGRSAFFNKYGGQVEVTGFLEGVTVSEVYFSLLKEVKESKYNKYYQNGFDGHYAYFTVAQSLFSQKDIDENNDVPFDPFRHVKIYYGIENRSDRNGVDFIMYTETPTGAIPEDVRGAYCSLVRSL